MSLYFDLVINCDLKENASADAVTAIQYFTQPDYPLKHTPQLTYATQTQPHTGNLWDVFGSRRFLVPDPAQNVISNFQRSYRIGTLTGYRYRLQYCGNALHGDTFYQYHLPFVHWLATIAYENYLGYYTETQWDASQIHHLQVLDGTLHIT